jgi:hypothetical protein
MPRLIGMRGLRIGGPFSFRDALLPLISRLMSLLRWS